MLRTGWSLVQVICEKGERLRVEPGEVAAKGQWIETCNFPREFSASGATHSW